MRRTLRGQPVSLPRIQRVTRRGKVYRYHTRTRARLPDLPEDDPAFVAAWAAEEAKGTPKPPRHATGTLGAAAAAYKASDRFLGLSEGYRRPMRRHLDALSEAYGDAVLAQIRDRHVRADLARLGANPARQRRKAWRLLCAWCVETGLLAADPTDGTAAPPAPKTDGHRPWTADHVAAFRARWPVGDPRRLAFEVLHWTGARRSDVVTLTRGMVSGGVLTYRQRKTGEPAHVPWGESLPRFADAESWRHLAACLAGHPHLMFIVTATGAPRSDKAFGQWFAEAARAAGVDRTAHGLRKTRLSDLAERGAPALALMSWGGHKTLSEVQHYVEAAERKRAVMGGVGKPRRPGKKTSA